MFSLIDLPFTYAIGSHPPQLKGHHQVSPGHAEARYVFDRLLSYLCVLGYIGDFEIVDDHRSGKIVINLLGRLNKCGVISPRFDVTLDKIEQLASDLLPSRQFGHLVLTTPYGIMDHEEARRKHTGGKILGFFF